MEEKVIEICEQYSLETGLLVEMEVVIKENCGINLLLTHW